MWRELANAEVRGTVGTGASQEFIEVLHPHQADKTESAGTGKLPRHVAHQAVAMERLAGNAVLAGGDNRAAGAAQAVLVQLQPAGHRLHRAFGGGTEGLAGALLVAVLQDQAAHDSRHQPEGQEQHDTSIQGIQAGSFQRRLPW